MSWPAPYIGKNKLKLTKPVLMGMMVTPTRRYGLAEVTLWWTDGKTDWNEKRTVDPMDDDDVKWVDSMRDELGRKGVSR